MQGGLHPGVLHPRGSASRESASRGVCMRGVCIQGVGRPPQSDTIGYGQRGGGMHPPGMHSY